MDWFHIPLFHLLSFTLILSYPPSIIIITILLKKCSEAHIMRGTYSPVLFIPLGCMWACKHSLSREWRASVHCKPIETFVNANKDKG